jgi:hypothetical protein
MRGVRRYGTGGGWKIADAHGNPWDFGDCRHRSALPEQNEESTAWGRTHAEDWCASHPEFDMLTASQAQLEASRPS